LSPRRHDCAKLPGCRYPGVAARGARTFPVALSSLIGLYDVFVSDGSRSGEELQTARLSLERPTAADIDAILEIHGDPRACLHNPSDRLTKREGAEELYQRWNEQWQRCGYGYWVVRRRGSDMQLGFCGIKPMELNGMRILNLFYRFTPSAWGQGLAGEAATAVVAWASRRVPDLPLIARVRPANVASQRVAIRAGLTRAERLDTTGDDGVDWIFAANLPVS
jgi:[ribosomal protein S5]-alanine N-acetyltransferase